MPEGSDGDRLSLARYIPTRPLLLTAGNDGHRSGVLAHWVQQCADRPPMVMVGTPKCLPVEPLIRDARHFALCMIDEDDVLLPRKFAQPPDRRDDPFVALPCITLATGAPVPERAAGHLHCRLARQIDLEVGFLLYVAEVLEAVERTASGARSVVHRTASNGSVMAEPS